jgi:EAL domain-containing protein (putative c-di-GMP-specific phosphodiesterase class I)
MERAFERPETFCQKIHLTFLSIENIVDFKPNEYLPVSSTQASVIERPRSLPGFRLAAQEIVPTNSTDRMQWVEFLLRTNGSSVNSSPMDFIRSAYANEGRSFDLRVVREAVREATRLPEHTRFSVNVLPDSLNGAALSDFVLKELASQDVDPERLILEIIEFGGAVDLPSSRPTIKALRDAGVSFALDDYGLGFSNLDLLSAGLIDFIKLDRSIVQGNEWTPQREDVLGGLQAFASRTGISLVAEGIETQEQLENIRAQGIGWCQGFLFSRPGFIS